MTTADRADAPIYASLVEKHGDVLAEARRVAEQADREVSAVMDFSRTQSLSGGPAWHTRGPGAHPGGRAVHPGGQAVRPGGQAVRPGGQAAYPGGQAGH